MNYISGCKSELRQLFRMEMKYLLWVLGMLVDVSMTSSHFAFEKLMSAFSFVLAFLGTVQLRKTCMANAIADLAA